MRLLTFTAMLCFTPIMAFAKPCQTDFCHISQVAAELSKFQYDEDKFNCVDFSTEGQNLLMQRGVEDVHTVTLKKGDLYHMVVEKNGVLISAGPDGVQILRADDYYHQWDNFCSTDGTGVCD